jgi:riboflavin biosynthesis pyrimidine reductase
VIDDPAAAWQLFPRPGSSEDEPRPVHGHPLLPATPGTPYLGLNMVATADGRATVGGTAVGLGSPTDQRLLRRLRAEADVVLHGAGTVRAHRLTPRVPDDLSAERVARGQTPQPAGAVVSGRGALDPAHPYFTSATPDWPRLVYTANTELGGRLARPGVEVVVLPGPGLDLGLVLGDLRARGMARVVCEGGPTLNQPLFARGLVDELFLTLAARVDAGRDALPLVLGNALPTVRLRLRSVFEREGELFLRYAVAR